MLWHNIMLCLGGILIAISECREVLEYCSRKEFCGINSSSCLEYSIRITISSVKMLKIRTVDVAEPLGCNHVSTVYV
jgi:hypothetical protein